jgi:hypothetical protein
MESPGDSNQLSKKSGRNFHIFHSFEEANEATYQSWAEIKLEKHIIHTVDLIRRVYGIMHDPENIFLKEHRQVLDVLTEVDAEFMITGGYAVIFHGYPKVPGDLDIWLNPDIENKCKVLDALRKLDLPMETIDQIVKHEMDNFSLSYWEEPLKVDFITQVTGVSFEEAFENRVTGVFGNFKVPFIGLDQLLKNRITNNSMQDQAEIDVLRNVEKYKK